MTIGYLPFTGDLFHVGHLRAIEQCHKLCDVLVIGLLSDGAIKKYKGQPPIIPWRERDEIILHSGLSLVVAKQHSLNPASNLKAHKIDVMFSGDGFESVEKAAAKRYKVKLVKIDYCSKQSTSKIKKKVYDQAK